MNSTIKIKSKNGKKYDGSQINTKPLNPVAEQLKSGSGPVDDSLNLPLPQPFNLSVTNASSNILKEAKAFENKFEKELESEENIAGSELPKKVGKYRGDVLKPNTEFPPAAVPEYKKTGRVKKIYEPVVIAAGNKFIKGHGSTEANFLQFSDDMDIKNPKDSIIKKPFEVLKKITKDSVNKEKVRYLMGHEAICKDPIVEKKLTKGYTDEQPDLNIQYLGKNVRYGYHGLKKEAICNIARKS